MAQADQPRPVRCDGRRRAGIGVWRGCRAVEGGLATEGTGPICSAQTALRHATGGSAITNAVGLAPCALQSRCQKSRSSTASTGLFDRGEPSGQYRTRTCSEGHASGISPEPSFGGIGAPTSFTHGVLLVHTAGLQGGGAVETVASLSPARPRDVSGAQTPLPRPRMVDTSRPELIGRAMQAPVRHRCDRGNVRKPREQSPCLARIPRNTVFSVGSIQVVGAAGSSTPLLAAIQRTGRCVMHEGPRSLGYGAGLAARIQEEMFYQLRLRYSVPAVLTAPLLRLRW